MPRSLLSLLSLPILTVGVLLSFTLASPVRAASPPVLFFSDLDSGPNTGGENNKGAYITIWGTGFGAARGTSTVTVGGGAVDNYVLWTDTKVIFQLGPATASGAIVLTSNGQNSNGIPFVVRAGTIYFVAPNGNGNGQSATPMSPTAVYNAIAPGVIFYFRQGIYPDQYGAFAWGNAAFVLGSRKAGTVGNPVTFSGYPGEIATFSGRQTFNLRDSTETVGDYITIANLRMIGDSTCIGGGHVTAAGGEQARSGAMGIRVVGNVLSATYTGNTMSGLITIGNNGWRVYGNEIKDTGTTPPINNNHAIYIQVGSSDIDVGWNYLHDLRMGHVIQVHTDTYFLYQDVRIHDNLIRGATSSDSRGISVGNTLPGSYGSIYNNVLSTLGQNYSAIFIYSGSWKVFNNTFHNIRTPSSSYSAAILMTGTTGTAEVRNNLINVDSQSAYVAVDSGASMSQFTLSNNLYYGNGNGPAADTTKVNADPLFINAAAGNFRLQASSPAIDRGTSAVSAVVTRDRDGGSRPYGAAFDIGAYEYGTPSSDSTPPTVSLTAPAQGATVSGSSVTVSATASDNVGVTGVQFQLDGANLGTEDLSSPYSLTWDTTQTTNSTHTLTAIARDGAGNTTTSASRTVTVSNTDPIPPTILSLTSSPASGSFTVGSSITITTTFSEAVTSTGSVTLTLETGTTDRTCTFTITNASSAACTYSVQAGDTSSDLTTNQISGTIRDQAGNLLTTFTPASTLAQNAALVIDTTPPNVFITAPTEGQAVSGTQTITASASDNTSIAGVQFKQDGSNLGSEDTTTPYSFSWNTTQTTNASHALTATARDSAGNTLTSSAITVTVNNAGDTTPPTLSQVTPIPSVTRDSTPDYTFSSTEAGTLILSGGCTTATTSVPAGSTVLTFSTLTPGTYATCSLRVTDSSSNQSSPLSIPSFTLTYPSDLNLDRSVNVLDFSLLKTNYGTSNPQGDVNQDGSVNVLDFGILKGQYGQSV